MHLSREGGTLVITVLSREEEHLLLQSSVGRRNTCVESSHLGREEEHLCRVFTSL